MKSPYVNELKPDQVITSSFLVCSKEIRQKKKGDPYLSLQLGDRTGELDAKMWDNVAEVMEAFERDDFVKVKGLLQIFHNRPQLTVHTIHRLDDREVDFTDYFPASTRDPEEMWRELRGFAAALSNPHLHKLVAALLDDEEIARRYRVAPAAKQIHHAYLGGLIEHVLSLCHLARLAAGHYPMIDGDLLVTGAIVHDVGKIYELSYERGFSYSDEGQLLGHMLIGVRLVGDKLRDIPDFPPRLRTLLEHMIISHHGQLEFGSPKTPLFPEAMLLHYLDDMDSKMECMSHLIEADRQFAGNFTTFSPSLERVLLKKDRYLAGPVAGPPAAPAKPPVAAAPPKNPTAAPKSNSVFGDKLLQALQPAEAKREG
ncbi:MAG TPA: OB-fold nucleic acid binding domain-containing protein [Bryobacteraceae bacterium]|nr:OB-fold nucleic acid binding domain-containing protein [Bryobacteraceae bacterium]